MEDMESVEEGFPYQVLSMVFYPDVLNLDLP